MTLWGGDDAKAAAERALKEPRLSDVQRVYVEQFLQERFYEPNVAADPPVANALGPRRESFEVHPSTDPRMLRATWLKAAPVLPLGLGALARLLDGGSGGNAAITVGILLAAILAGVALVVHYLRTNRLYVTPSSVGRLSALLERPKEVPRQSVARLVRVDTGSFLLPQSVEYLLFVGKDGRCLMRASSQYYNERGLATLARAIGVPYDDPGFVPARKLCRDIPGAAPWIVRHPWLPGLIAIPAIFIVGTLFFAIYFAIAGHYPA